MLEIKEIETCEIIKAQTLRAVFKTLNTIGKRSDFINPYSFLTLLKVLPIMLEDIENSCLDCNDEERYPIEDNMLDRLKEKHVELLIGDFSNKYDSFQLDPTAFLREMAVTLNPSIKKEFELMQLHYELVRFIETHLDRLIWSPEDGIETWRNVEEIAQKLTKFFEDDLLDDINLLDDFYNSLTSSYCRFIDYTATLLSDAFYKQLKNEIKQNKSIVFNLVEEDSVIETRNEYLSRVVLRSYSRKQASKHGIVT